MERSDVEPGTLFASDWSEAAPAATMIMFTRGDRLDVGGSARWFLLRSWCVRDMSGKLVDTTKASEAWMYENMIVAAQVITR